MLIMLWSFLLLGEMFGIVNCVPLGSKFLCCELVVTILITSFCLSTVEMCSFEHSFTPSSDKCALRVGNRVTMIKLDSIGSACRRNKRKLPE